MLVGGRVQRPTLLSRALAYVAVYVPAPYFAIRSLGPGADHFQVSTVLTSCPYEWLFLCKTGEIPYPAPLAVGRMHVIPQRADIRLGANTAFGEDCTSSGTYFDDPALRRDFISQCGGHTEHFPGAFLLAF